jgi:hypothetical protein
LNTGNMTPKPRLPYTATVTSPPTSARPGMSSCPPTGRPLPGSAGSEAGHRCRMLRSGT